MRRSGVRVPWVALSISGSGCSSARLERYVRDVEAGGSNPLTPTKCPLSHLAAAGFVFPKKPQKHHVEAGALVPIHRDSNPLTPTKSPVSHLAAAGFLFYPTSKWFGKFGREGTLTHSLLHSFTHSLIHSFTHSFTHKSGAQSLWRAKNSRKFRIAFKAGAWGRPTTPTIPLRFLRLAERIEQASALRP